MSNFEKDSLGIESPEEQKSDSARNGVENVLLAEQEAAERNIDAQQWIDLTHVAEAIGENKEWIDKNFDFPGDGTIVAKSKTLNFSGSSLVALPRNLKVHYLNCSDTSLASLPKGLGAHILDVSNTLIAELPEDLKISKDLTIKGCKSLSSISTDLDVGDALVLSRDLNPTVIKQAEEWEEKGRLSGGQGIGLVWDKY